MTGLNKLAEDSQGFAGSLNKLVSTSLNKPARPIRKGYQKGVPAAEGRRHSFLEAAEGRLPLRMGLAGLFKLVETSLFKLPGNPWESSASLFKPVNYLLR